MLRLSSVAIVAAAIILARCAYCAEPADLGRWSPPAGPAEPTALPRLSGPLALDGDLAEWAGAAAVPVRCRSLLTVEKTGHPWRGPADAGMEILLAWTPEGLCVAAEVADDEVINTRGPTALHQQDCIEVFIDGRHVDRQMTAPASRGAMQLYVRPPTAQQEAAASVNPRDGRVEGIRVAGRRTPRGYVVEMLVPWSAVPAVAPKAGSRIALHFELDDYDLRDQKTDQPRKLACGGARNVWRDPRKFTPWVLAEKPDRRPQAALGPTVAIDAASVVISASRLAVGVGLGRTLAQEAASVTLTLVDPTGAVVAQAEAGLPGRWSPGADPTVARTSLPLAGVPDGCYALRATVRGSGERAGLFARPKPGPALGDSSRTVVLLRQVPTEAIARLEKAKVGAIAQTDPFRAAGYLGAASTIEVLKRAVVLGDAVLAAHAAAETLGRLAVLEGAAAAGANIRLLDMLNLAGDPAAQVVVQYPVPDRADVVLYCGAVPFLAAHVSHLATEQDVRLAFEPSPTEVFDPPAEKITVQGYAARLVPTVYDYEFSDRAGFDPTGQVALVQVQRRSVNALQTDLLWCARADAAVVLPDCPSAVREKVEAWAKAAGVSILSLDDGLEQPRVLLAGDIRAAEAAGKLKSMKYYVIRPTDSAPELSILARDRLIRVLCPSRKAGEEMARLVLERRPITAPEADRLRHQLIQDAAPPAPAAATLLPEGTSLLCGDLHMHTFFSDGSPSPAGLTLRAKACFMDFVPITDHNILAGALEARRLMSAAGFAWPPIVGLEITTRWAHFNAWPVTDLVSWTGTSAYDIIRQAHAQGAAIQWNHPGFPGSQWELEHMKNALADLGAEAWEHVPIDYDAWKQARKCPLITGTSDTHTGTFGEGECTILAATSPEGADVAEALRWRRAVAVVPFYKKVFYGPDDVLISAAWAALRDGKTLRQSKAARIREDLARADVAALIRSSPPRPSSTGSW